MNTAGEVEAREVQARYEFGIEKELPFIGNENTILNTGEAAAASLDVEGEAAIDPQADPIGYLRRFAEVITDPATREKFLNETGYLRRFAEAMQDEAARAKFLNEIKALKKQYPPGTNDYLSPNGKPSKLNHARWYLYKTDSFKEIYGDWEAASRIEFGTVAPDNIVKQWKANIEIALGDNSVQGTNKIHISNIPYVYSLVGIKDKPLKTKKQVLLKAMGQDPTAPNIHYVTRQMLDNLIEQIYDPVAIFKSLSTSSSPDRYVAIIDEVDTRGDIVIVIISPSKIGNGYSFIITAYGHDKFNNFVKNTANEGRILYVKDRGAQVWGRLQLPPQHT